MSGTKVMVIFVCLALPMPCWAVNFYDGVRAGQGLYVLTYSSLYSADKTTDAGGSTTNSDYDYRKLEELVRFCYYTPEAVFTAMVPAGRVESGYYDIRSSGIGDVIVGAGHFLPIRQCDILPMFFVKFPNGEYDSGRSVNYGTNQYDIRPVVFFYKGWKRFSIDAAAKYYFRLENPKTDTEPGDELHLQCLLGWQLTEKSKIGPSLNWMRSADRKTNNAAIPGTARESVSAGFDLYVRFMPVSITFTYLRDVHSENTAKGDFFQLKTCSKF